MRMEPMASSLSPLIIPGGGLPDPHSPDESDPKKFKRGNLIVHFEIELPKLLADSPETERLKSAIPGVGQLKMQYLPRQTVLPSNKT